MKRIICTGLLLCLLLNACGQKAPTWQEEYDLGVRYLSEGNYEEAILAFTAAIEIDPKQAPAYVGRGDAYVGIARLHEEETEGGALPALAEENYRKALEDYLLAVDLDGTLVEAYRKAAEIYVALGDTEAAITLLEQGAEATGDSALQDYLTELQESMDEGGPLMVLVSRTIHCEGGGLPITETESFFYDEQGYAVRKETHSSSVNTSGEIYESSRAREYEYSADKRICRVFEENGNGIMELKVEAPRMTNEEPYHPGASPFDEGRILNYTNNYGGYTICGFLLYGEQFKEQREEVQNNGGIFRGLPEQDNWYAVYTFNDDGYPVEIVTYKSDDTLMGTCTLEWAEIEPAW